MGEIEQLEKRVKILNRHITCLKLFVVFFCLTTVLLNTYHIHRLKTSSSNLGFLMSLHSNTMKKLNIAKQVTWNNGFSTGSTMEEKSAVKFNVTTKTFYTENKKNRFDPLSKISKEQLLKRRGKLKKRIEKGINMTYHEFLLPVSQVSNPIPVFKKDEMFSKNNFYSKLKDSDLP